jgi:hypothetical protein
MAMLQIEQMNVPVGPAASPTPVLTRAMRAIVHPRYGTPDVLLLGEVYRPVPGDDDVLVRVHARLQARVITTSSRASRT